MIMSRLLTQNPIALRFLMSETIFSSAAEISTIENSLPHTSLQTDPQKSDLSLSENKDTEFLFWGANEKNILFLIENPNEDYFSEEAEDAFLKTLAAMKLSLQDVAVFNRGKAEYSLSEIHEKLQPKICIYCNGENERNQDAFNTLIEANGISSLTTYSFEEMLVDTQKKPNVWNCIKGIIGILLMNLVLQTNIKINFKKFA